jgi:hypothetical protein
MKLNTIPEPEMRYIRHRHTAVRAIGASLLASLVVATTIATSCAYPAAASWSGWQPVPDVGAKWHLLSGPFVTDSVCSATAPSPSTLYLVAKRASDHTIWWNATDNTQQVWDGWREIPGGAHTAYPPSISYYGSSYGSQLDVVAVGIKGGTDHAVYMNSYSVVAKAWSGWTLIPGLQTDAGVSIVKRHLYAKQWLYASPSSAVFHNDYNLPAGWMGWKVVPDNVKTTVQVCAYPADQR